MSLRLPRLRTALAGAVVSLALIGAALITAAPGGAVGSGVNLLGWGYGPYDGHVAAAAGTLESPGPVALPDGARVAMIAAHEGGAGGFALALTTSHEVYAWGSGESGQLGRPPSTDPGAPAKVAGLPADVVAVAAGADFALAVTASGQVWAWGRDDLGQLGTDPGAITSDCPAGQPCRATPIQVPLPAGVFAVGGAAGVDGGDGHALVLTSAVPGGPPSAIYGWGFNGSGQLGRVDGNGGTVPQPPGPMDLPAGVVPAGVSTGNQFTLVLAAGGAVYSCGYGFAGQLGNGQNPSNQTPTLQAVTLGGSGRAVQVAAGEETGFAVMDDGAVRSWGRNDNGQRGDGGDANPSNTPGGVTLPAGAAVAGLSTVINSALVVTRTGAVYGWGDRAPLNAPGNPGGFATTPELVPLPAGTRATAVALTSQAGFAITSGAATPAAPAPVTAKTAEAEPVSGTVLVKAPGTGFFVPLKQAGLIPVGSTIDTRKGVVRLTTTRGTAGGTQSARFDSGIFTVAQKAARSAITELRLVSSFRACPKPGVRAAVARRRSGKRVNRVWGDGKGRYRVTGHDAATAVKGTRWLTEDRCDGTFVRVARGAVTVADFGTHRTVTVRAGGTYLARRR